MESLHKQWLQVREEYRQLAKRWAQTRDSSLNPRLSALTTRLRALEEEMLQAAAPNRPTCIRA